MKPCPVRSYIRERPRFNGWNRAPWAACLVLTPTSARLLLSVHTITERANPRSLARQLRSMTTDDADRPPRYPCRIVGAPSIRQLFWCDLPKDAICQSCGSVDLCSSSHSKTPDPAPLPSCPARRRIRAGNVWAYRLKTTIDGHPSWVICDKPSTVAVSRLASDKGGVRRLAGSGVQRCPGPSFSLAAGPARRRLSRFGNLVSRTSISYLRLCGLE